MRVTMLGTSSMVPTRTRGAPAILVECEGESILIDCGEGTQRQMQFAGKSRAKVRKILLTHWHGDHVGGLAPLLQTMAQGNYQGTLELWGPLGTLERLSHLARAMELALDRIRAVELDPPAGCVETFLRTEAYTLSCAPMRHGLVTVGYSIETPGHRRVDMNLASELGLSPGPIVGRLQKGEAVEWEGRTISPEAVTYWQPGRKLTVITDTVATPEIVALAPRRRTCLSRRRRMARSARSWPAPTTT